MVYNAQTARRTNPAPIGTEIIHTTGHLMRKVTTGYKGWKAVHRIVMEEKLGRPLQPGEIVHHINHNKLDNRPENLQIMSKTEHSIHHNKGNQFGKLNKLPRGQWSHEYDACIECGLTDSPHQGHGLCKDCYMRNYQEPYKQRPGYYEKKREYHRQRRQQVSLSSGKWATQYDACIECGTTERRHAGQGLCNACYCRLRYHTSKHTE